VSLKLDAIKRHRYWYLGCHHQQLPLSDNKKGFLPALKDAFRDVFTEENCRKAFEAPGPIPLNAQFVLGRLEVRLRTLLQPPPEDTPWQSETLMDTHEFGSQSKLVGDAFSRSPVTAQAGFSQLI
jgi:hypothetical protein